MPFERFVETGRVAYVNSGPYQGKLVSIVDIIDQNRVLVDGPASKIPRSQMRLSDLHLTKFRLKFPFTGSTRTVRKAWISSKIEEEWQKTMWAQKVEAKKKRLILSDFDRFKLRRAKRTRNNLRTTTFFKLKKVKKQEASKKNIKPTKSVKKVNVKK